ncbi:MAG: hypothetical protein JWO13_1825 [Acidobacteriales bacterium]|nr:hypothetical protein [Terriglobales bacterium]
MFESEPEGSLLPVPLRGKLVASASRLQIARGPSTPLRFAQDDKSE